MRHPNRAGGNSTPTCVWHAYANFYQFINIIIMQITKTVLRTYEYYGKKNHDANTKIPSQTTFNLSKSEGKSEILIDIKCTNT